MQQTALTFEQKQAEYIRLMEAELEIKRTRNDIFEAYREFRGRYAVLIGGSGSGKSYEIADKLVDRIVHEDGHRILCVRAQLKQVRQSQIPLIESRIDRRYDIRDFKINRSLGNESIVYKPNGNEFLFWGLDDPGKLKSIFDITSDWIEEADQTTDAALREINRRLRGYQGTNSNGTPKYMQHSLSFNPVSVLSWLNDRFFKRKKANQIMLHGQIPFTDCKQYLSALYDLKRTDTLVIHSTFLDNKFIDAEYESVLRELKEFDEDEYNVYALGMWGVSGGIYFDATNVNARIMANPQPIKQGYFEYAWNDPESFDKIIGGFAYDLDEDENVERRLSRDIKWIDDPSGPIKLFTEPIFGHPYVAGGDTAGEGSDYNTGAFTDNTTGADVASLRTLMDEDEYARQMYCLGRYYNDALMAIETNFSTHPVKELERLHYPDRKSVV